MAESGGRLIFPVKIDLEGAFKNAQQQAPRLLSAIEKYMASRPVVLTAKVDTAKFDDFAKAFDTSSQAIQVKMQQLVSKWDSMKLSNKWSDGKLTAGADNIVKEYLQLLAQLKSNGKSLSAFAAEIERATAAKEKNLVKARETKAMLQAEETSLTAVAAKMEFYQEMANRLDFGLKGHIYATKQIKRLGVQYERLKSIMKSNTGNKGKDQFGIETMKQTLKGPEVTISQIQSKLKVLNQLMLDCKQGGYAWTLITQKAQKLNGVLAEMKTRQKAATGNPDDAAYQRWLQQKDAEVKAQQKAETEKTRIAQQEVQKREELARNASNITGSQVNTKHNLEVIRAVKQEYQKLLAQLNSTAQRRYDIKLQIDKAFEPEIKRITKDINTLDQQMMQVGNKGGNIQPYLDAINQLRAEIDKIKNDKITLFNSDAIQTEFANIQRLTADMFTKLRSVEQQYAHDTAFNTAANNRIANINRLHTQIANLENEFRRLQTTEKAYDNNGNLTSAANKNLTEQIRLTRELEKATATNAQEMQKVRQGIEAWEKMCKTLSDTTVSMGTLNAKLELYQNRLKRLDAGSDKWNNTAIKIRNISTELERVNQKLTDFQQKAFQGLSADFTKGQVEKLTTLRNRIIEIDAELHKLQQDKVNGASTPTDNTQSNALLKERIGLTKQINEMLKSGSDLQAEREKEINKIIEQRKARAQAIADKKKQETQAVQANIAKLKEERRILNQKESSVKAITDKLTIMQQRLNTTNMKSGDFERVAKEVERLTRKLEEAKVKITQLTEQSVSGTNQQKTAHQQVTQEFNKQTTYIERLIRRMAVYGSISYIGNFLTQIREVTAQFELQRISLGAIIQDQNRANALFTQIKGLALESPFKILDLTKYTKQLAAYQIETDKLFDTMKSLADVSAGLGVSMDRLILAYGQVYATGHLRASEVRQFTEAGLPIVEELAKKLSTANGELVKASDVMDMISKREIPFEMVAEIFEDMTEKGGIFYDMQKIQGETLYGMWQKLGDAASMMWNDIGSNKEVMKVMQSLIEAARSLMLNWKQVGATLGMVGLGLAKVVFSIKSVKIATMMASAANMKYIASLQAKQRALEIENMTLQQGGRLQEFKTKATLLATKAEIAAAQSTNMLTRSFYKLKAAMLSNPWTLIATAILTIVTYFSMAEDETKKLSEELTKINDRYADIQRETHRNLPKLAEEAVNAADGSRKQREALEELSRTYGNIIPQELLTIDNLRSMQGEYEGLIALVDDYNTKRKHEEREAQIKQTYEGMIKSGEDNARDWLNAHGVSNSDPLQSQIVQEIKDNVANGMEAVAAVNAVLKKYENEIGGFWTRFGNMWNVVHIEKMADAWEADMNINEIYEMAEAIKAMNSALAENDAAMDKELADTQRYEQCVSDATIAIDAQANSLGMLRMIVQGNVADAKSLAERWEKFVNSDTVKSSQGFFMINEDAYNKTVDKIKDVQLSIKNLEHLKDNLMLNNFDGSKTDDIQLIDQQIISLNKKISELRQELTNYFTDFNKLSNIAAMDNMPFNEQFQEGMRLRLDRVKEIIQKALEESGIKVDIKEWGEEVNGQWIINFEKLITIVKKQGGDPRFIAALIKIHEQYKRLIPEDTVTKAINHRIMDIANTTDMSMGIIFQCLKSSAENWEDYAKRVKDTIEKVLLVKITALKGEIHDLQYDLKDTSDLTREDVEKFKKDLKAKQEELVQAEKDLKGVQQIVIKAERHVYKEDKTKKKTKTKKESKQDERLQNLQEIEQTLTKINTEYEKLLKQEGKTRALADIQHTYQDTLDYVNTLAKKFNLNFAMPTEFKTLQEYRKSILKVIESLKKIKGSEKAVLELQTKIDTGDIDRLSKDIEKQLKEIAEKISRTKTARDFYKTIFESTGDIELAAKVSIGLYNGDGWDLKKDLADQIREYFKDERLNIEIPTNVIGKNDYINYKSLGKFIEQHKEELGEKPYEELKKLAQKGQDEMAKRWQGYYIDIRKADEYAQKISKIEQTAAEKIRQIRKDIANNPELKKQGEALIDDIIKKQMQDLNKLEWEAYQNTALYVQMFENLEYASTSTLQRMRDNMEHLSKTKWPGMLSPGDMKEVQNNIEKIDEQLTTRNPWKQLVKSYKEYKAAISSTSKEGAQAEVDKAQAEVDELIDLGVRPDDTRLVQAQDELAVQEKILDIVEQIDEVENNEGKLTKGKERLLKVQQKTFDLETRARNELFTANQDLAEATNKAIAEGRDPANDVTVKLAQERVKNAEKEYNFIRKIADLLARRVKKEKKLKETLAIAGQQAVDWMNMGVSLAQGISTSMEALGADEEDVQYFSDIAEGLGDITSGFQGLVDAVTSGNVADAISAAVGIVPNMIKGFSTLLYAGRIRKANKEITKQAEILEELQYAYERLQNAADKLFGTDYINNYNKQMQLLVAEQKAYQKQAEAERSKGKKADKEKIKEYEKQARETADEIAEMENALMERMSGTERTSLAKEFAESWLDAKVAFESTTDAIKSKYKDMIKSMIVEGAAAKIIDAVLAPMWETANNLLTQGNIDGAIDYVVKQMDGVVATADRAMNTLWSGLQAQGYDLHNLLGEDKSASNATGIKRDYATASEESINGLAAGINTQNWYISHVPEIAANVKVLRGFIENGYNLSISGITDLTEIQRQALSNLQGIERHTAETVNECKRIAKVCQSQVDALNKVIVGKNSASAYGIQVYMR